MISYRKRIYLALLRFHMSIRTENESIFSDSYVIFGSLITIKEKRRPTRYMRIKCRIRRRKNGNILFLETKQSSNVEALNELLLFMFEKTYAEKDFFECAENRELKIEIRKYLFVHSPWWCVFSYCRILLQDSNGRYGIVISTCQIWNPSFYMGKAVTWFLLLPK